MASQATIRRDRSLSFCTINALRWVLCLPSDLIMVAPEQPPDYLTYIYNIFSDLKAKYNILDLSINKCSCVSSLIKIKSPLCGTIRVSQDSETNHQSPFLIVFGFFHADIFFTLQLFSLVIDYNDCNNMNICSCF